MSISWNRLFLCCVLCLSGMLMEAQNQNVNIQPKINSPFSRYGLGDLVDPFYVAQAGMAGLTAAFYDPYTLNILNPASLSQLQATSFEVGFNAKYSSLKADEVSEGVWSGNLNYLALGFPLINPINKALDRRQSPLKLGMAFALQPYTEVGYNVETILEKENTGPTTNSLKGTGGTYRIHWGNGIGFKDFTAGVTLGYQFGKLTNSRRVVFDSVEYAYTTEFLDEISTSGFFWRAGVQYTHHFKKPNAQGVRINSGKRLIFGLHGNSTSEFNTNTSLFYQRYSTLYGTRDTLAYDDEVKQKGTLPSEWTAGVSFENVNKLRLGVEYGVSNWTEYSNEAKPETSFADAWHVALGGEYIPNHLSYNNYFQKVRYRFGAYYNKDPRTFDGEQLSEYGITLGMGMPIVMARQRVSFVNLALEVGQFGLTDTLKETFVKIALGFTLNDNTWFFKRKFN